MNQSAKKLSVFVLAAIMIVVLLIPAAPNKAEASGTAITELRIRSGVNMRSAPSGSASVVRLVRTGETVRALQMANPNWYQIQDSFGNTGFISTSSSFSSVLSNAVTLATVNFRSAPSTSGSVIRNLPVGEKLYIIEKVNASWYRTQDTNGVAGFISTIERFTDIDLSVTGIILPLEERIEAVIAAGMSYLGTPYEFGSARWENSTFDCSDFTQTAFWEGARTAITSDSRQQADGVRSGGSLIYDWTQLKRGDLMFFMSSRGSNSANYQNIDVDSETVTHVGIYLGDGQMLHTFSIASGGVRVDTMAGSQWNLRFLYGGSVY